MISPDTPGGASRPVPSRSVTSGTAGPRAAATERSTSTGAQWRCRRGLLELDIVLQRFLERRAASLSQAEVDLLGELLDFDDNDLWNIVNGRSDRYEPRHRAMVCELRAGWILSPKDCGIISLL